ncbi:hypothetical protein AQI94_22375 [Streptomyces pseudovenezuelae]|uniref:Uncharacterized protein n=1 Tax=Streptomyces pseudovenezuelae TaxID=67350 RepID=A0A117PQH5_9ACTN|nr:hypothetical protein AQI94_22375 [Streptomyces pseudovenezuelae]
MTLPGATGAAVRITAAVVRAPSEWVREFTVALAEGPVRVGMWAAEGPGRGRGVCRVHGCGFLRGFTEVQVRCAGAVAVGGGVQLGLSSVAEGGASWPSEGGRAHDEGSQRR